jgi:PRD domain.
MKSEEVFEKALASIVDKLKEKEIVFKDDNMEMVFHSHIQAMVNRLKNDEVIKDGSLMPEEVKNEISTEAMDLAKSIIHEAFEMYDQELSEVELVLVATHMQLYLASKEA